MVLLILFGILGFITDSTHIQLSEKPLKKGLINVEKITIVKGKNIDFYKSISTYPTKKNIYTFDRGNKKVFVYNALYSFGKVGNGPGEFIGRESLISIEHLLIN